MSTTSSSPKQRFLARAATYSFFTPLIVLLVLLIFLTLSGGRETMRACELTAVGFCVSSILAGLVSLVRIFHNRFDGYAVAALVGIALAIGVGFISYVAYGFSFWSC